MARRLTLLVLLTCAAAATRPRPQWPARPARPARPTAPPPYDDDYSAGADSADDSSVDPFVIFDDYDSPESFTSPRPAHAVRPTPPQRFHTTKSSAKVIIRAKGPKVNATVKNSRDENKKKVVKTTTINIETYTNLLVTEKPQVFSSHYGRPVHYPQRPMVPVAPQYDQWPEEYVDQELEFSTRRPLPQRRPVSTRRPTTSQRPTTTRRHPTTTRPRASSTTSKPKTTRKATPRTTTKRPQKSTKKPNVQNNKKTTCPPKNTPWLSSFFQGNKVKKTKKKPSKQGIFSTVYKWIWGPSTGQSSSWFSSSWFADDEEPKSKPVTTTTTTTTTPAPAFATTPNWFQNLLESEEDEAYVVNDTKKSIKKSAKKNYKGYQLLRAYPDLQWKVHEMLDLEEEAQGSGLMWWTKPSINGSTDMLVPPDLLVDIKDHLKSSKIDFDVIVWDLHKAIMYENPKMSKKQRMELEQVRGHPMTWRRYHRYSDMLRYLEYLQLSYSDFVELIPLGRSSEGLPLVAVKVSIPSSDLKTKVMEKSKDGSKKKWRLKSKMKPAVWIEGGAHAREWIAPAVATWMLHALVEGEKGLEAEHELLRQADFYIMPVLNPDGYEHSHTHDRLWRKTRSRPADNSDDYASWLPWNWGSTDCVGVDPDRNWDYHWGEQGASKDPCSEHYAGPHPFSEPETRAVSSFLAEHRDQIKVYISLHAYSQVWMMPSSHAHAPYSDDGVLMEMGKLATVALADLYGTKYQVGTAAELRQPASGMSHDWAKARAGIKFSYHVDLRDSFGPYGFLLPGSQIVSTAKETWQAVKAIIDNLG